MLTIDEVHERDTIWVETVIHPDGLARPRWDCETDSAEELPLGPYIQCEVLGSYQRRNDIHLSWTDNFTHSWHSSLKDCLSTAYRYNPEGARVISRDPLARFKNLEVGND